MQDFFITCYFWYLLSVGIVGGIDGYKSTGWKGILTGVYSAYSIWMFIIPVLTIIMLILVIFIIGIYYKSRIPEEIAIKQLKRQSNLHEMIQYLNEKQFNYIVRKEIVYHKNCPVELVKYLLTNDENWLVRMYCLNKLNWPKEMTEIIASHDPCESLRLTAKNKLRRKSSAIK